LNILVVDAGQEEVATAAVVVADAAVVGVKAVVVVVATNI
jgi:hypothetical protein